MLKTMNTTLSNDDTSLPIVRWAQKAGGSSSDYGYSIAVDNSGNIYTTGNFSGTATFGNTTLTSVGSADIFITKQDSNGNYLWAQKAGGSGLDSSRSIRADSSGNIYTTGNFSGTATFGNTTLTSAGSVDIFITKQDSNGNYLWAQKAGGSDSDYSSSIAVDNSGNIYTTGYFYETATFGNTTLTSAGNRDIFITKQDSNGDYLWAQKAGGSDSDYSSSIAVDNSGNIYTTGYF
ncbi:SBBP repeat-containing protein, partial [Chrysosporum bergii ANA360D]